MKQIQRGYRVGEKKIDDLIDKLTGLCAYPGTEFLLREIFTTVVKLGQESGDKATLSLLTTRLKIEIFF
jgi:hypothetical protein